MLHESRPDPRSVSTTPFRIGSDAAYNFTPEGGIDDLRVWTVARTQDQILATMTAPFAPELRRHKRDVTTPAPRHQALTDYVFRTR